MEVIRRPLVSQPGAFATGGETRVVNETEVKAQIRDGAMFHVQPTASLSDVVDALNALGARPRNLIAIFQALRSAGALQAEFEVQ